MFFKIGVNLYEKGEGSQKTGDGSPKLFFAISRVFLPISQLLSPVFSLLFIINASRTKISATDYPKSYLSLFFHPALPIFI
jgi:hypothetical protein